MMSMTADKQDAHQLFDQLDPGQAAAVATKQSEENSLLSKRTNRCAGH
jgi:hypothetical protein